MDKKWVVGRIQLTIFYGFCPAKCFFTFRTLFPFLTRLFDRRLTKSVCFHYLCHVRKYIYLLSLLLGGGMALVGTPLRANVNSSTQAWAMQEADRIMRLVDETVKERLAQLDQSIVDYRYDPSVRYTIALYVERWRSGSERILGRSAACFPYFSKALEAAGMPDALKYISITESALRPFAVSHVGAAGYWQLMPGTARELGLQVDDVVDERLDIELGTAAGLRYLQMQYERYGDWALALAAYNSGPGRVNRAKRRSGSNNFWKLRKYLPKETSGYVPSFIAATYLATFFREHELTPLLPPLDIQMTETITVYESLSLHRVAMVTALRPDVIVELNPAYLAGYLPPSSSGRSLRLPSRVAPAMIAYLKNWHQDGEETAIPWRSPLLNDTEGNTDGYYEKYQTYLASTDTSYFDLASALGTDPYQLLVWSGYGSQDTLAVDQEWTYYRPACSLSFGPPAREAVRVCLPLPSDLPSELSPSVWAWGSPADLSCFNDQPLPIRAGTSAKPTKKIKRIVNSVWSWIKA